uniref:Galactosyltransferase C-terminal domain-containing protein n=1 Tax=Tetranychus urticae TaxID=32264 RepID=T1KVA5_TETUR
MHQKLDQSGNETFNKGVLMNAGVKEALKDNDYHCFIFHDVDLIPEDDRNLYSCPSEPRHMSVAVDKFNYTRTETTFSPSNRKGCIVHSTPRVACQLNALLAESILLIIQLPYSYLVGGVFAITKAHFVLVNGYSNLYWGWGGEDDDMAYR